MEELIIVPDVHCRNFWKKVLTIKDKKIIFLGDYLDPYPNEGFPFENGLVNLEQIIDFKKENPERVTLLFGNHDFNALWKMNWASRHNYHFQNESHSLFADNLSLFEPYKIIDNILFTHAGVCEGWVEAWNIKDPIEHINTDWNLFLQNPFKESYLSIFDCGYSRGGDAPYGGIFWHDVYESYWTNPIDYIQIYGHSQLNNTGSFLQLNQEGKPMYCCDSREVFVWKNNELKNLWNLLQKKMRTNCVP